MTQIENSATRATARQLPAPSFLRVISACAMVAPVLALIIAHVIAVDAQDQADLVVASLEWTTAALAVALALRGVLQVVAPRLPTVGLESAQLGHDAAGH